MTNKTTIEELPRVSKFGILLDEFADLAGTRDLIVSIVDGLLQTANGREIILIYRTPMRWYRLASIVQHIQSALRGQLKKPTYNWLEQFNKLKDSGLADLPVFFVEKTNHALQKLSLENKIDVIGPIIVPTRSALLIPWIGYIYDFQHIHLPMYFSKSVIRSRNRVFTRTLRKANVVIVNARNVMDDAHRFLPEKKAHIVPLPFSAKPSAQWFSQDAAAILARYGITSKYFLISNQFWAHKRHEMALKAFAIAANHDPGLQIVLTGDTHDTRSLNRLNNIYELISDLKIGSRVLVLGLIPKNEQMAIMRNAVAVIQPTEFEGGPGGGSIQDAIALGVTTIVSDIPVNREIEEFIDYFFDLDDIEGLASIMIRVSSSVATPKDRRDLVSCGLARRQQLGDKLWEVAALALDIQLRRSKSK